MDYYYLEHVRDSYQRISASGLAQCRGDFFRQWRDPDGSIPWRMFCQPPGREPVEIDPYQRHK